MPTPSFEDAPDGSSSINHTSDNPNPPISPPPHPSYEDGSAQIAPPHPNLADIYNAAVRSNPRSPWVEIVEDSWRPNLNTAIGASHVAVNPNRRIEARMFSQGEAPFPANAGETVRAVNPEWGSAAYQAAAPENRSSPPRRTRRGPSDPDAAIRKDPNAWSLREAVELCKLLEVVVPEAGFHIALTGGLLYKEGRRKDCDLMFYQIRQVDPNYEILWKYLTVAGVIRSPSYPENGWLVKATYRGKQVDCLFPNAGKKKKTGAANADCYKAAPPTPPSPSHTAVSHNTAVGAQSLASNNAGTSNIEIGPPSPPGGYMINPAWEAGAPVLVRHNDGAPIIYHRIPEDLAEFLATTDPAPVTAAAEAQDEIPF